MPDAPDPILAVLEAFQRHTGKLLVSEADHAQAKAWVDAGMPLSVIQRGMQDKFERAAGKFWVRTAQLSWCDTDVRETYVNWRRAVGPRSQMQVDERG